MNKNLSKIMYSINKAVEDLELVISDISIRNLSYEYIIMLQLDNKFHIGMRFNSMDIENYNIPQLAYVMNDFINIELLKLKEV
jgi:hypothetical protein